MSKAAKLTIMLLMILLCGAVALVFYTSLSKQQVDNANGILQKQLKDYETREKKYLTDNNQLQQKVKDAESAKADIEKRLAQFSGVDVTKLNDEIKKVAEERDNFKKRVAELTKEREALVVKLSEKSKAESAATPAPAAQSQPQVATTAEQVGLQPQTAQPSTAEPDENYWAQILKEKAGLELELDKLKEKISSTNVELAELKKQNSDLQLAISELKNQKDAIERDIKYGKDLSDTLSLELARAQNDKKFLSDRIGKVTDENTSLRDQIKQLTSTKIALEKSIVRLQDGKKDIEKKLLETENVVQGRIDEIWALKESLDKGFKPTKAKDSGQIELPPIVVSNEPGAAPAQADPNVIKSVGVNGNVVSVNEENNFVIVDIGQAAGLGLGDKLSVYRGSEYVAGLEVIQLRKDIAAADIKNKVTKIQVGDVVR